MAGNLNDVLKSLETSNVKLKDLKPTTVTTDGVAVLALTGYAVVIRTIAQDVAADQKVTVAGKHFTGDNTISELLKAVQQHGTSAHS